MLNLINIYLISVCWVIILDLSGFSHTIKKILWKFLRGTTKYPDNFNPKPFVCSMCQTWWFGLLYMVIAHCLTIPMIAYTLIVSVFTSNTRGLIIFLKDILTL